MKDDNINNTTIIETDSEKQEYSKEKLIQKRFQQQISEFYAKQHIKSILNKLKQHNITE